MEEKRHWSVFRDKRGPKQTLFSEKSNAEYAALRREKQRLGMVYGALAGLSFSLATWGLDAILLTQAHADLPWLRLLVGSVFCTALGMLAGWLGEYLGNGLITFLGWIAAGIGYVWFLSRLPFEIQSILIGLIYPDFRGLVLYPILPNIDRQLIVTYIVTGIVAGLIGALQNYLVDSARGASYPINRALSLGICIPFMLLAGNSADNLNEPLRSPILGVNQVIENALQAEINPVDKKTAADMRLRAVDPLRHLLHRPRRLVLGSYDVQDLDTFAVYIDFDGIWASCSVLIDSPSYCKPSDDLYPRYLGCLLRGEESDSCHASITQSAQEWLESHRQALGLDPQAEVTAQRGDFTLVDILGQDNALYRCRFSGIQFSAVLRECELLRQDGSAATFRTTATLTPSEPTSTPQPTLSATATSNQQVSQTATRFAATQEPARALAETPSSVPSISQGAALLPDMQEDLAELRDLTRYSIQLHVDYAGLSLLGHSRVVYTNTESVPLDSLYFRLLPNGGRSYGNGSLRVDHASQDGQPVETSLSVSDSVLEVKLANPLDPGERSQIEMDFAGAIPKNYGETGYGIYNYTQGVMALAGWYPLLAVYDESGWNLDPVSAIGDSVFADMALYTVELTIDQDLVVAATGVEVDRHADGSKNQILFVSGPVREFFLLASDSLQVVSQTVQGTTVNSYYLPEHAAIGRDALEIAVNSLRAYNKLFGVYPYTELDVVDAPMNYAAGVEFPGIVLVAESLYTNPRQPTLTIVVAHEAAHQWWYNLVGNDVFDHPWLDEALTTYSSALYYEEVHGLDAYQANIEAYQAVYDDLLKNGNDDLITAGLSYYEQNNPGGYGAVVYRKGALFFHVLRQEIGDEAFFQGLRAYFSAFRYRIASPPDLLDLFEQTAGRQLDDFYQEWLYSKQ